MSESAERDAVVAQLIRAADLEIARVLQRFGAVGGLFAARVALKQALTLIAPAPEVKGDEAPK